MTNISNNRRPPLEKSGTGVPLSRDIAGDIPFNFHKYLQISILTNRGHMGTYLSLGGLGIGVNYSPFGPEPSPNAKRYVPYVPAVPDFCETKTGKVSN
jgi:hypothetical protein